MKKFFKLIEDSKYVKFDLKITLKPIFMCNQGCWFCTEYDNKSRMWSENDYIEVINSLKNIIKPNMKIFFYFYGGEPTMSQWWEYIIFELMNSFPDNELFIQTQTNLSISNTRLEIFLKTIKDIKKDNHKIELCTSYHPGKQSPYIFKTKLQMLKDYNCLGYCFFSTDITKDNFMEEFYILDDGFSDILKFRFTEIHESLIPKNYPIPYIGKNTEYLYMCDKYGKEFIEKYLEDEFIFNTHIGKYNFNEVLSQNVNQFRLYNCECYTKNIVIDHNLNVYHCNDDFKAGHKAYKLSNLKPDFISQNSFCLNKNCYDGLEFKKWK